MIPDNIIKTCLKEASKSTYKHKVGCVIFNKKTVISKGHNYACRGKKDVNGKSFQAWPGSIHAEVDSITNAREDLKGYDLLVIRLNKNDEFRLSKPCNYCLKLINHVNIRKIYYSISTYPFIELY